jgi:uncharacterized protein
MSGDDEFHEVTVEFGLDDPTDNDALRSRVARQTGIAQGDLPELVVLRRSLDARHGRARFRVLVGERTADTRTAAHPELGHPDPKEVGPRRVAIVGDGPAGLFCAYELARHGIGSVVIDRGKKVQPRRHDLKAVQQRGEVPLDSNYCFGEGGAGTYSDGKLYTRAHKRGNVRDALEILARHSAPESILVDARPHIGSNRLPKVVTELREHLESVGVVFRFESRVEQLLLEGVGARRVAGVRLASGEEIDAEAVVLATGHSARGVWTMLAEQGVTLEAKPFAMGVRIEHPQPLINRIQYGKAAGHPKLPSAAYRVATQVEDRGVFSFCMCPGGFVVPASTEPTGLVVNGMSLSRRDSPYANSGLVVAIELEDLAHAGFHGPLAGVDAQCKLEETACVAGGGDLRAPAARVDDFIARRGSSTLPDTSYIPGLASANLDEVLDSTGVLLAEKIRSSFANFQRSMRGYVTNEAVLIGVESRTSSPVRVPRDRDSLQSPDIRGLYPCGEGAGYAGGIISAALDGMRVARALSERFGVAPAS